jgi:hypothetical protein
MKSFAGPETNNFRNNEMNNETVEVTAVPSVDAYLALANKQEGGDSAARAACDKYLETYFGVYNSDSFKRKEYEDFIDAVIMGNLSEITDEYSAVEEVTKDGENENNKAKAIETISE